MNHLKKFTVFLAAIALIPSISLGQKSSATSDKKPAQGGGDTTRIGVLKVRLPITVKDKKNQSIGGLNQQNFEVYENGVIQKIDNFQAPSQLSLRMAVLLDTSESVKLKLPFEKEAAEDFIATITTYRRKDQVLFATFDSDIELLQDFTDAQEPLIRSIRSVKAGGYTKLYDAIYRVIEEKMAPMQEGDTRKIILVISDGADTASEKSLKDAIEMAERYDVTIFGISTKNFTGITSGMGQDEPDKELALLCSDTGGQLFLPSQKLELFRAFGQVAQDLRQEYVVYYTPPNQDRTGKHRGIKVKLLRADGKLYHKLGYTY